jgi:hypothetical protein
MKDKYGKGNWENKKGPGSEFNQIKSGEVAASLIRVEARL